MITEHGTETKRSTLTIAEVMAMVANGTHVVHHTSWRQDGDGDGDDNGGDDGNDYWTKWNLAIDALKWLAENAPDGETETAANSAICALSDVGGDE